MRIGELTLRQRAQFAAGKAVMIDHQAGDKTLFLAVTVGHAIVYRLAAAGAVQEIEAVSQVIQQCEFKLTQRLLR
ncbi:hypothetical protein D3C79_988910 [compost metagenome]